MINRLIATRTQNPLPHTMYGLPDAGDDDDDDDDDAPATGDPDMVFLFLLLFILSRRTRRTLRRQ